MGLIDCLQSAVVLCFYTGGGLDPLPTKLRANPTIFVNKHREKLRTLICSARARTVRPTGADRPAHRRGPSGPQARTVRTADRLASGPDRPLAHYGAQHHSKSNIYKFSKKDYFKKKTFKCDEKFVITSNIFSLQMS